MKVKRAILAAAAALILAPAAAFCSAAALGRCIAMNRLVTPNGDHKNDSFIFRCYNPRDAAVDAKIYDMKGREVATMSLKRRSYGIPGTGSSTGEYYDLEWDPNAGGHKPGGVYIYQISLEGTVYKGTITVVR